jgi:hypothetical protein
VYVPVTRRRAVARGAMRPTRRRHSRERRRLTHRLRTASRPVSSSTPSPTTMA